MYPFTPNTVPQIELGDREFVNHVARTLSVSEAI